MRKSMLICSAVAVAVLAPAVVIIGRARRPSNAEYWQSIAAFDHRNGRDEAQADIRRGQLKWKVYGFPGYSASNAELLRARLGVEYDRVAGSGVTQGVLDYVRDYNRTVFEHLADRYGKEFVRQELKAILYYDRGEEFETPERANQSPEPTGMLVTPRAGARVAPSTPVAHL